MHQAQHSNKLYDARCSPAGFQWKPKRHTITICAHLSMWEKQREILWVQWIRLHDTMKSNRHPRAIISFYKVNSPVSTCTNSTEATNFPLQYHSYCSVLLFIRSLALSYFQLTALALFSVVVLWLFRFCNCNSRNVHIKNMGHKKEN